MAEGYGACLMKKPDLLCEMIKNAKNRVGRDDFTVSIKIRIHPDIRYNSILNCCKLVELWGNFIL